MKTVKTMIVFLLLPVLFLGAGLNQFLLMCWEIAEYTAEEIEKWIKE